MRPREQSGLEDGHARAHALLHVDRAEQPVLHHVEGDLHEGRRDDLELLVLDEGALRGHLGLQERVELAGARLRRVVRRVVSRVVRPRAGWPARHAGRGAAARAERRGAAAAALTSARTRLRGLRSRIKGGPEHVGAPPAARLGCCCCGGP